MIRFELKFPFAGPYVIVHQSFINELHMFGLQMELAKTRVATMMTTQCATQPQNVLRHRILQTIVILSTVPVYRSPIG